MKNTLRVLFAILLIGAVLLLLINIKPIVNGISIAFWNTIGQHIDNEEKQLDVYPYGRPGKDTAVWLADGKFQIINSAGVKIFVMYNKDGKKYELMKGINNYKVIKEKLYFFGDEGYGVVAKDDNICRLFIIITPEEFVDIWWLDGNKTYVSRYILDEDIVYLESYNNFLPEERAVFDELTK